MCLCIPDQIGIWKGWLLGGKPLRAREKTNNKLNPHMASMPGFEPGPYWWEASALTTAPYSLPRHLQKLRRNPPGN